MSRITSYLLITVIILIMNACFMPAEVQSFLEDDKVREIIKNKKTGAVVEILPPETADLKPLLLADGALLPEGHAVIVSDGAPATIVVSNAGDYTAIEWYFDDEDAFFSTGESVSTFGSPFVTKGWHTVIIVGTTTDGMSYSTFFYVDIGE
ncbi:MAG: hypothetical protein FWG46_05445 [Treponema sp.]|nr:hypothetical protein [Treponema sp.]